MTQARLLDNLLLFGRVLHGLGLEASPARMVDLVRALRLVDLGRRRDVQQAMRALLVRRREELAAFDAAFDLFWRRPPDGVTPLDLRAMGERRLPRRPSVSRSPRPGGDAPGAGASGQPAMLRASVGYSADEVLRHKDFAELTGEELDEVRALLSRLSWRLGLRRTRRSEPGPGPGSDLRRSLRRSLRHGGDVLEWASRRRRLKPRPLVVLADVSGSMERYTRLLLLFLYALAEGLEQRVEGFAFATRLTRVTRQLRGRDAERALAEVSRAVPDWSGGTRIGEALRAFNFEWARRLRLASGLVLLISDGWDRGAPELLAREMARLQRSCHRLLWLNPLLGAQDYEPLARGMRAALPYVDDFLPVHNLASLEDLGDRLALIADRRPARRQVPIHRS
jgi:hypothetical protein